MQAGQNGLVEALMPILEPGDNEALVTMAWTLVELAGRHGMSRINAQVKMKTHNFS
jgi:hypothetical protein